MKLWPEDKKKQTILLVLIGGFVLLIIGGTVGSYFYFHKTPGTKNTTVKKEATVSRLELQRSILNTGTVGGTISNIDNNNNNITITPFKGSPQVFHLSKSTTIVLSNTGGSITINQVKTKELVTITYQKDTNNALNLWVSEVK